MSHHPMHLDKSAQDRLPVDERPRVKQWQARIRKMRGQREETEEEVAEA